MGVKLDKRHNGSDPPEEKRTQLFLVQRKVLIAPKKRIPVASPVLPATSVRCSPARAALQNKTVSPTSHQRGGPSFATVLLITDLEPHYFSLWLILSGQRLGWPQCWAPVRLAVEKRRSPPRP